MTKDFLFQSHQCRMLLGAGILLLLAGSVFWGCAGTPQESPPPVEVSSKVAPPSDLPAEQTGEPPSTGETGDKEAATAPEAPEATVGGEDHARSATATADTIPGEGKDKDAAAEEEIQKGPVLRIEGIFDGFIFSVPAPLIRWTTDPEGVAVRVELATDIGFEPDTILWTDTTTDTALRLPELSEGSVYYLRIGIVQNGDPARDTVFKYSITYKPFSIPMRPVLQPGSSVTFRMGYDGGLEREKPEHPVTLTRPYALGTFEVTNEEFATVMNPLLKSGVLHWEGKKLVGPDGLVLAGADTLDFGTQFGFLVQEGLIVPIEGREKHPVVGVSWYGAWAFCYYLSLMEGLKPAVRFDPSDPRNTITMLPDQEGYRLPTEAEWEYAARGEEKLLYPGRTFNPNGMNFYRSGDPFEGYRRITEAGGPTTPVGFYDGSVRGRYRTFKGSSPFGHFDLLGNVWEWCQDWFRMTYYRESPPENPAGPETGTHRVVRGGGWNTLREDLRFTIRGLFLPEGTSYSIGFRVARTLRPTGE
ncbi:MAG: hypothetical protein Kow009_15980 [Spirochaetales bacterium]